MVTLQKSRWDGGVSLVKKNKFKDNFIKIALKK